MMKLFTFALALICLALPVAAPAANFNAVQPDKSSLIFVYKQMGVAVDGRFRKFAVQMSFDPTKPDAAKAAIDVDLSSIDTGSSEGDDEVAGKQWFNSKAFPVARFESSVVKPLGGNRYEVSGKLTMKGRAKDMSASFTFVPQGNVAVFDGAFVLKRADFSIGEGQWGDFDTVANEIQIKFHILAAAGK
jgi:polyisoprenoid-binding protein YceI